MASDSSHPTVYVVKFRAASEWLVIREGGSRASSVQASQKRAEAVAIKLARKVAPAVVKVYKEDGSLAHEDKVERASPRKASTQ